MGLNDIIQLSNSKDFYQNVDLKCIRIHGDIKKSNELIVDFNLEDNFNNHINTWRITANKCLMVNNIFKEIYMPFIQIKFFDEHPLLWEYNSILVKLKIKGYPKDIEKFLGQIYRLFINKTKNWIQATKFFYAVELGLKRKRGMLIELPSELGEMIGAICEMNELKIEKSYENKHSFSYEKYGKMKALIFCNEHVSPKGFNIGQPYVIANDFYAERL